MIAFLLCYNVLQHSQFFAPIYIIFSHQLLQHLRYYVCRRNGLNEFLHHLKNPYLMEKHAHPPRQLILPHNNINNNNASIYMFTWTSSSSSFWNKQDLFVVSLIFQISWRITVQWIAGNVACKAFLFLRAFGLYLSSNVLVCVSLDRYFAVLHPLKVNDARRRGKFMLACAWGISLLYSVPQVRNIPH